MDSLTGPEHVEGAPLPASPYYNHSIAEDVAFVADLRALHSVLSASSALRQAVVLVKVSIYQSNVHTYLYLNAYIKRPQRYRHTYIHIYILHI
jgi:hypothetical protein